MKITKADIVKQEVFYDDGNWYACTLGHFISLLVDAGTDPAVVYRVRQDSEPDEDGQFTRVFDLVVIPNGQIRFHLEGCRGVHKTLIALLEAEVLR